MVYGLLITFVVSILGIWLSGLPAISQLGLSSVTVAILLGMILGNTGYHSVAIHCHKGVDFSKSKLLRWGIILYGFNVTFQQISMLGINALIANVVIVVTTYSLGWWIGRYVLKMDAKTVILVGFGASICGAAAIMASEPVVRARVEKVTVAVASVVIFGTMAMFLYPEIYHWNWWGLSDEHFGLYIGSSIHEVAQVYAAGNSISESVAGVAVTTKMIRVMMLAPFLLILSILMARGKQSTKNKRKHKLVIPWFAVGFIIVAGINSLGIIPDSWVEILKKIDVLLLTMAMAALGLTTHLRAIRQAGIKPLLLGAILFLWLIVCGAVLQMLLP